MCPKVQILHLYDNDIASMVGLEALPNLKICYLQRNKITRIEGLDSACQLTRLDLSFNQISCLEGMVSCPSLQELDLSSQTIESSFVIEEESMITISRTLRRLAMNNCQLEDLSHLWYCDGVEILELSGNSIQFSEDVFKVMTCMNYLSSLRLDKNPISKRGKYRDEIITMNGNIRELDGKEVTKNEREYIYALAGRKQAKFRNQVPSQGSKHAHPGENI